ISALNMLGAGYSVYDQLAVDGAPLPGAIVAQWLNGWVWLPNVLLPITFLLLLFPDGQLPSSRWRPIAWAAGLGIAVWTFALAFQPATQEAGTVEVVNPFGIPGSVDFMNALITIATPVLLVGISGSIASVVVRYRRARGIQRAQLKWLAFAGVFVIVGNVLGGLLSWYWRGNPARGEIAIFVSSFTIIDIFSATGF